MKKYTKKQPVIMDHNEMNLSLNGCGYLGIYHVGVCSCIRKYYPHVLRGKISGGSVGALVACAFMCNVPLDICAKYVCDVSMKVRNGILGPMSPDLNIMKVLYESMDAMLPPDAHLHCDGRLYVSVTRFDNGENALLNRFKTRHDLLQALMCSCFIPVYCGYEPPEFYGVAYVDAALSNNSPWINKYTVSVAPFSGNSDICPENDGFFMKSLSLSNTSIGITTNNMYMLFRVLFPASPDIQMDICQRGYNDTLRFLRDNDMLPCTNCVSRNINLGHVKCESPEEIMSTEISNEIENFIQEFKNNIGSRIFQYRSMKMLYYFNMPSIVTAKVIYVLVTSVVQKVHSKNGLTDIWSQFLNVLRAGLYSGAYVSRRIQSRNGHVGRTEFPSCLSPLEMLASEEDNGYSSSVFTNSETSDDSDDSEVTSEDGSEESSKDSFSNSEEENIEDEAAHNHNTNTSSSSAFSKTNSMCNVPYQADAQGVSPEEFHAMYCS
ncbi:patanin-like phospholipase domain-containing protein atgl-1 [Caerostris darwini]|uniref:Patanin-like phospholipase domain-containing protein atgl-1 n=1 Tax=Caerostris darwini TaxID=1538125 RepID=A0AAV4MKF2_9ARAC|nr:patanin-like phospholipase domain-containing protein atgl-1 [Caerostris darwini]